MQTDRERARMLLDPLVAILKDQPHNYATGVRLGEATIDLMLEFAAQEIEVEGHGVSECGTPACSSCSNNRRAVELRAQKSGSRGPGGEEG